MSENPHKEFLALYKSVHEQLVRFCGSHAYGIMETDDLVQETVLQTMQGFERVKDKSRLIYFMIGVANNIIKNELRRKKFDGKISEAQLKKIESIVSEPSMALDIQYLYEAMNRLPLKMKEALILFEINGFSMKEIAEIQTSSESAVKTSVSRGREKLRMILLKKEIKYDISPNKTLFNFIL